MANITNEESSARKVLREHIEKLLSVESLEYHDKNLLSGDNETRCKWKQETLHCCLDIIKRFEL